MPPSRHDGGDPEALRCPIRTMLQGDCVRPQKAAGPISEVQLVLALEAPKMGLRTPATLRGVCRKSGSGLGRRQQAAPGMNTPSGSAAVAAMAGRSGIRSREVAAAKQLVALGVDRLEPGLGTLDV
jgi:hypothetical protein